MTTDTYINIEALPASLRAELEAAADAVGGIKYALAAIIRGAAQDGERAAQVERLAGTLRAGMTVPQGDGEAGDCGARCPRREWELLREAASSSGVLAKAAPRHLLLANKGKLVEAVKAGLGISI